MFQVVICDNNEPQEEVVCEIVAHELIHAFDTCRAKLDFENIDHLACTEVNKPMLLVVVVSMLLVKGF